MELEERNKKVLQAVIDSYIQTGAPVGSSLIYERFKLGVSPATIRNIMAELEELGFLTHPHTSAGRVPTDRGYRYYIDSLISMEPKAMDLGLKLKETPGLHADDLDDLMEEASNLLARLSRYTGLVVAPSEPEESYKHIEFVRLAGKQVFIIFVTSGGAVQNKLIELDESISQQELNAFAAYLEEELEHHSLADIRRNLLERMREERAFFVKLVEETYQASKDVRERESEKVFIGGASQMLENPEFANVEKLRVLFKTFEDKYKLLKLLDRTVAAEGIKVFIGSENPYFEMQGCSLVVSGYQAGGKVIGTLGVIGPTRMQYKQVIQVVDYTSKLLSKLLNERYQRGTIGHDNE